MVLKKNKTVLSWSDGFRFWVISLLVLVLALLFYHFRKAINPIIIGCLIAYILNPIVDFLHQKMKMNRTLALNIVFWLSIGITITIPVIFVPILAKDLITLIRDLQEIYILLQERLSDPILIFGRQIPFTFILPDLESLPSINLRTITQSAFYIIGSFTHNFLWLLVILATIYFLLKDWPKLREWVIGLTPPEYQSDVRVLHEKIKVVWRGYLRGNLLLMLIVGVVFSLVWLAIGLPVALVLGLLTGLLTIIPDLGPAIAAGVAILVALFEGSTYLPISNYWFAALVFGIYMVLINLKNVFVRPKLFGRSVHLHEGVVFISIMIAVLMQGIMGALVVVPALASFGVIGKYILRRLYKMPAFEESDLHGEYQPDLR